MISHALGYVLVAVIAIVPSGCRSSPAQTVSTDHRIDSNEEMARAFLEVLDTALVASGIEGLCQAELGNSEVTRYRLFASGIYVEPLLIEVGVSNQAQALAQFRSMRSVFPNGNEVFEIVQECEASLEEAGTSRLLEEVEQIGFWRSEGYIWVPGRILHGVDIYMEGYTAEGCHQVQWSSSSPKEEEWDLLVYLHGVTPCGELLNPILKQYESANWKTERQGP